MAFSHSFAPIAPSQKWRREWYYLDYDCDQVHHDLMLYGYSKTKQYDVAVTCTDCSNSFMLADFNKHRRTCLNKKRGCEWSESCGKEHLVQHLNTSPDECNWLDGCDYAKINCVYCNLCRPAERREIKGRLEKSLSAFEEKDFRLVLAMTWDARSKWYNFGLALGVSVGTLDCIQRDHSNDNEKCFMDMIRRWLIESDVKDKSFKSISRALKSVTVGYQRLAEEVEKGALCRNAFLSDAEHLLRQVDKKVLELKKHMHKYNSLTDEHETKMKGLKKNKEILKGMKDHCDEQAQQIRKLKNKYIRENLDLSDAEKEIKGFREELDDYSQKLGTLQEDDQQETLPPEIQNAISCCCKRMDECNEHISKLKEEISQNEVELKLIKENIFICKRNIVHAIDDLKRLKKELERSKERLERERRSNIARYACAHDTNNDYKPISATNKLLAISALVTGSSLLFGPLPTLIAAGLTAVYGGSTITNWIFGSPDKYNEKQHRIIETYDLIISKISLAASKLEAKYSSCEKILETKRVIINDLQSVTDTRGNTCSKTISYI